MSATQTIQILSITTALLASGGIATLSLFDIPMLKSQPASRSLPMTRWLFSRGSHIFPTASLLSTSGFAYLAYTSLPPNINISTFFQHATKGKPGIYFAAAALAFSIAPWTTLVMLPTNFALIQLNEELGGTRSAASARYREKEGMGKRPVDESIAGKDDASQWSEVSGPQEKAAEESSKEQDEQASRLLERFGRLNWGRAVLMGLGGAVGLLGVVMV